MALQKKENFLFAGLLITVVVTLPLVTSENIDCKGKAFYCVNSTHFKICVDLGGGVSKTVDDFLIPCPRNTACKDDNYFECEYQTTTTLAAIRPRSDVTNDAIEDRDITILEKFDATSLYPEYTSNKLEELRNYQISASPSAEISSTVDPIDIVNGRISNDFLTKPVNLNSASNSDNVYVSDNLNESATVSSTPALSFDFSTINNEFSPSTEHVIFNNNVTNDILFENVSNNLDNLSLSRNDVTESYYLSLFLNNTINSKNYENNEFIDVNISLPFETLTLSNTKERNGNVSNVENTDLRNATDLINTTAPIVLSNNFKGENIVGQSIATTSIHESILTTDNNIVGNEQTTTLNTDSSTLATTDYESQLIRKNSFIDKSTINLYETNTFSMLVSTEKYIDEGLAKSSFLTSTDTLDTITTTDINSIYTKSTNRLDIAESSIRNELQPSSDNSFIERNTTDLYKEQFSTSATTEKLTPSPFIRVFEQITTTDINSTNAEQTSSLNTVDSSTLAPNNLKSQTTSENRGLIAENTTEIYKKDFSISVNTEKPLNEVQTETSLSTLASTKKLSPTPFTSIFEQLNTTYIHSTDIDQINSLYIVDASTLAPSNFKSQPSSENRGFTEENNTTPYKEDFSTFINTEETLDKVRTESSSLSMNLLEIQTFTDTNNRNTGSTTIINNVVSSIISPIDFKSQARLIEENNTTPYKKDFLTFINTEKTLDKVQTESSSTSMNLVEIITATDTNSRNTGLTTIINNVISSIISPIGFKSQTSSENPIIDKSTTDFYKKEDFFTTVSTENILNEFSTKLFSTDYTSTIDTTDVLDTTKKNIEPSPSKVFAATTGKEILENINSDIYNTGERTSLQNEVKENSHPFASNQFFFQTSENILNNLVTVKQPAQNGRNYNVTDGLNLSESNISSDSGTLKKESLNITNIDLQVTDKMFVSPTSASIKTNPSDNILNLIQADSETIPTLSKNYDSTFSMSNNTLPLMSSFKNVSLDNNYVINDTNTETHTEAVIGPKKIQLTNNVSEDIKLIGNINNNYNGSFTNNITENDYVNVNINGTHNFETVTELNPATISKDSSNDNSSSFQPSKITENILLLENYKLLTENTTDVNLSEVENENKQSFSEVKDIPSSNVENLILTATEITNKENIITDFVNGDFPKENLSLSWTTTNNPNQENLLNSFNKLKKFNTLISPSSVNDHLNIDSSFQLNASNKVQSSTNQLFNNTVNRTNNTQVPKEKTTTIINTSNIISDFKNDSQTIKSEYVGIKHQLSEIKQVTNISSDSNVSLPKNLNYTHFNYQDVQNLNNSSKIVNVSSLSIPQHTTKTMSTVQDFNKTVFSVDNLPRFSTTPNVDLSKQILISNVIKTTILPITDSSKVNIEESIKNFEYSTNYPKPNLKNNELDKINISVKNMNIIQGPPTRDYNNHILPTTINDNITTEVSTNLEVAQKIKKYLEDDVSNSTFKEKVSTISESKLKLVNYTQFPHNKMKNKLNLATIIVANNSSTNLPQRQNIIKGNEIPIKLLSSDATQRVSSQGHLLDKNYLRTYLEGNRTSTVKYLPNGMFHNTHLINEKRPTMQYSCANRYRGKYSDGNNCNKFYICIGKLEPIIGMCPVDTVFSEVKKQCTKNLSHCIRNNQFKCLSTGRFIDILSDEFYYICVQKLDGYVRYKLKCQQGYYLNKANIQCTFNSASIEDSSKNASDKSTNEKKSLEFTQSSNNEKNFECEKEGKYEFPEDCRKYYVCTKRQKSRFRRKIKKCDSDEVFNKEKSKCVDADSYEC